jgi:HD-GYP domain-containing protein (c-di-GMP phosphodiesterase class II)
MRISSKLKLVTIAVAAASTAGMCAAGYLIASGALMRALEGRVIALAQTVSASVAPEDFIEVANSNDPDSPAYARLVEAMRRVQASNAIVEYPITHVYLLAVADGQPGAWEFVADAATPGTDDWSPPGETYDPDGDGIADMFTAARPVARRLEDRWGRWLSGYAPLVDGASGLTIGLAAVDVPYSTVLAHLRLILWVAIGIAGVLGLASTLAIGRAVDTFLRPLGRVRAFARAVGEGGFPAPLPTDGHDELSPVAQDLNVMAGQLSERARIESQNRSLRADVLRKAERLAAIASIDTALNRIQDADILIERILHEARDLMRCEAGSVFTSEGGHLTLAYVQNERMPDAVGVGTEASAYRSQRIPVDDSSMAGYVARTNQRLVVDDAYAIPASAPYRFNRAFDESTGFRTRSVLTVPLRSVAGQTIGVLQLINPTGDPPRGFSREDLEVIEPFASAATVALERAQLTRAIVLRMIRMAEMRDPNETGAHVNRVAATAVLLYEAWAKARGVPPERMESERDTLRIAAMLHDVGKVGIPDAILKKPGRLDEVEFDIMKRHTVVGAQLFMARETVLDRAALEVALHHHERWDGGGYPGNVDESSIAGKRMGELRAAPLGDHGLRGTGIPLFARIVCIADVFDALCSARCYKPAWTEADAVRAIEEGAGTQFDPELVALFMGILPAVHSARARYA